MKRLICILMACLLSGCSAKYWGGVENPGLRVEQNLFGAKLEMTSDGESGLAKLIYEDKDGRRIELDDFYFGQQASDVVKELPAMYDAAARVQETQAVYVTNLMAGVRGIVSELMPLLKLLAMAEFIPTETGWTASLPGGISIGRKTVSTPQELQDVLREIVRTLEPIAGE